MVECTLFVSFLPGIRPGESVLLESKGRVCSLLIQSLVVNRWHGPMVFVPVIVLKLSCQIRFDSPGIVSVRLLLFSLYLGLLHVVVAARLKFWLGSKLLLL